MPQVTASKLPIKLLAVVFGALAALVIVRTFLLSWQIIPPGYTGIKINRLVDRGITRENVVTGFVFYNPVQTVIIQYPTYVQRVIWTQDLNEGRPVNEELTFNTKDAVPVNVDVAVSYQLDR
jgi:regulator of protease activity HflC (stomatin/prohibitin superfamily)